MVTRQALDGHALVMKPTGPLVGGPETEELVEKARAFASTGQAAIILNLCEVPFINSLALGAIASILATCSRRNSWMKVCCLCPRVHALFDVVKFFKLFEYYDGEEQALEVVAREMAQHT